MDATITLNIIVLCATIVLSLASFGLNTASSVLSNNVICPSFIISTTAVRNLLSELDGAHADLFDLVLAWHCLDWA